MKDFQRNEIRRGPYINVKTGEPIRVYQLQTGLYYADPFDNFEKGQLPDPLTDAVAQNLLRLTEPAKISRLFFTHPI